MEVSCSRCQRRYAVADHKVVGRRRTSRCRCGNLLIFDGRLLSAPEIASGAADAQPLEPTLTPTHARTEVMDGPTQQPQPQGPLATAAPPSESQNITAEAPVDSQSIGRIRLRKAEPRSAEAEGELRRPRAPNTRVEHSASKPPDSPRSLHEAFDSLDFDRLAESIQPTWEAPASRRVTPPGENPEVVVHYPLEWQPPPSERRRMRATWEVTPTLPLSLAPQTSNTLDDDWDSPADEPDTSAPPSPAPSEIAAEVTAQAEPTSVARPAVALPPSSELGNASDSDTPGDASPRAVPAADPRAGKSGGPGLESTAPIAVSQLPRPARRASGARLWGAGFAAAAVLALVWRSTHTQATDSSGANPAAAATPARLDEASERAGDQTAPAPRAPVAPAPGPVTTHAVASASASAASAPDTPAPATPEAPTTQVAPATQVAIPAPAPKPAPVQAPSERPPVDVRGRAPASAPAAPARTSESAAPHPAPPSAEATGPDARDVAQALSRAAAGARGCTSPAGLPGNGSIRILLDPAGGVLNATALGAFQGTAAGACVENAFRTARTPAYDGRSLSTVYPFSISVD